MSLVAWAVPTGNRLGYDPGITVKEITTLGEMFAKAVIPVDPGEVWHGILDFAEADALLRQNGFRRVFSWAPVRDTGLWAASVVPL
jgi:hypothetical protein